MNTANVLRDPYERIVMPSTINSSLSTIQKRMDILHQLMDTAKRIIFALVDIIRALSAAEIRTGFNSNAYLLFGKFHYTISFHPFLRIILRMFLTPTGFCE